ncbi:ZNT6-like protein [Mya arenaria]|uniref:ZNT6-like protein n=1 Tax=Mya arenaria TaxID=6604 RepID=A0ABY7DSN9_MYAAR|nr:ZNT6-like protein [Mya arenaria]
MKTPNSVLSNARTTRKHTPRFDGSAAGAGDVCVEHVFADIGTRGSHFLHDYNFYDRDTHDPVGNLECTCESSDIERKDMPWEPNSFPQEPEMSAYGSIPDLISSSVTSDTGKASAYETSHAPPQAKKIVVFLALNVFGTGVLFVWCHDTNSMALTAYTYLTIFDIFSLLTCLLSVWVRLQRPTPAYSFGIERIIQQPEIHTGRLLVGVVFGFMLHMFLVYSSDNKALNHVMAASSSSWLQEHTTDISESICHVIPGLTHMLGQLDKVLREASTLDGVLEFREEHFWTLSFGSLAGSVQVRVRRDANEQLVLAHVYNRLSNLVSTLTIQIFKDDWTRASTYIMGSNPSFPSYSYSGPNLVPARGPSPTQEFGGYTSPGGIPSKPPTSILQGQQIREHGATQGQGHFSDQGHGHSHGHSHAHEHSHGGLRSQWH